jgi:hypothetical protein
MCVVLWEVLGTKGASKQKSFVEIIITFIVSLRCTVIVLSLLHAITIKCPYKNKMSLLVYL